MRKMSDNGVAFTAAWETFSPVAYKATPAEQYYTIGFGHYGPDVKAGQTITREAALELLHADMAKAEKAVDAVASQVFNQAQIDAIVDLCFNVGTGAIGASTGTGQAVRQGDVATVRAKLAQFINQNGKPVLGLKRRATGRIALFDGKPWQEAERTGRMLVR